MERNKILTISNYITTVTLTPNTEVNIKNRKESEINLCNLVYSTIDSLNYNFEILKKLENEYQYKYATIDSLDLIHKELREKFKLALSIADEIDKYFKSNVVNTESLRLLVGAYTKCLSELNKFTQKNKEKVNSAFDVTYHDTDPQAFIRISPLGLLASKITNKFEFSGKIEKVNNALDKIGKKIAEINKKMSKLSPKNKFYFITQ